MSEYDLLAAWFRVADWVAYDLAKRGAEGVVLKPLGRFPKAAAFLARAAATSSDFRHRKVAASLTGWVEQPPPDLLAELFRLETERDRRVTVGDVMGRLETQSVVEDIVFSAALWARREQLRPEAFRLLRDVVERTVAGEYWNTASYAITTLCWHQAPEWGELLARFEDFAFRGTVDHPSGVSLRQEKDFALGLAVNNPKTLAAIESLLDQRVGSATGASLDARDWTVVDDLARAAERFEG